MQKQIIVAVLAAFAGLTLIGGLFFIESRRSSADRFVAVTSSVSVPTGPKVVETISSQQEQLTFNGQEPSLSGLVKEINGDTLVIEVVEQPLEGQGVVSRSYRLLLGAKTAYVFSKQDTIDPAIRVDSTANKEQLVVGSQIMVFTKSAGELGLDPISASRIMILQ